MKKTILKTFLVLSLLISFDAQAKSSKNKAKKTAKNKSQTVEVEKKSSDQNLIFNDSTSKNLKTTIKENIEENSQNLTKGHIVGFNLMESRSEYREAFSDNTRKSKTKRLHSFKDSNRDGFDLNYKYAFNFDKFFIAPGFFYEKTKTKITGKKLFDALDNLTTDYANQFVKVNNRAGIKADFGYDFHDKFSPYLTTGISRISYTAKNFVSYSNGVFIGAALRHGREYEPFYGFGIKSNLTKNISLNLEYQRQDFTAQTTLGSFASSYPDYKGEYKTRLELFKLGLGYSF